jgi:hypothetical protein
MSKEIKITQGKVAIVDDEDFEYLSKFKWYASSWKGKIYAKTGLWVGKRNIHVPMHRMIMKANQDEVIDHINGNGLDNRRINLRSCDRQKNQFNQKKRTCAKTSAFKGVHFESRTGRWRASIKVSGKDIKLGRYDLEIDAAHAYDKAAIKYHGSFANVNFSEGVKDETA